MNKREKADKLFHSDTASLYFGCDQETKRQRILIFLVSVKIEKLLKPEYTLLHREH